MATKKKTVSKKKTTTKKTAAKKKAPPKKAPPKKKAVAKKAVKKKAVKKTRKTTAKTATNRRGATKRIDIVATMQKLLEAAGAEKQSEKYYILNGWRIKFSTQGVTWHTRLAEWEKVVVGTAVKTSVKSDCCWGEKSFQFRARVRFDISLKSNISLIIFQRFSFCDFFCNSS